jgi:uncharacterized protein
VTSGWTLVEFTSALARLDRMKRLEGDVRAIAGALEEHARSIYAILELTGEDYEVARGLLLHDPSLGLRGPDALHLAIAWRHGETLYTLDQALLECAAALRIPATDAGILSA